MTGRLDRFNKAKAYLDSMEIPNGPLNQAPQWVLRKLQKGLTMVQEAINPKKPRKRKKKG